MTCPQCSHSLQGLSGEGFEFCPKCQLPLSLLAGKYRILRLLGRGGFGALYEAVHTQIEREAERVIKTIKPGLLESESMQKRFFREIQITATLAARNPHIVRIHDDFGEIPGLGHFYVMELLKGHPLSAFLAPDLPLMPLELCFHLFFQLCQAMEEAHEEEVIHRDLKPANMMVIRQRRDAYFLKVIDFGIAKGLGKQFATSRLTQGTLGTPLYMAPEQSLGHQVGPFTDIYSMGIILYELLVGRTPFSPKAAKGKAPTPMQLVHKHVQEPPPAFAAFRPKDRDIPEGIEEIVRKALEKDPLDRFASVGELEEALQEVLKREGISWQTQHSERLAIHAFSQPPSNQADRPGTMGLSTTGTPEDLSHSGSVDGFGTTGVPQALSLPTPQPGPSSPARPQLRRQEGTKILPPSPEEEPPKSRNLKAIGLGLLVCLLVSVGALIGRRMFSRQAQSPAQARLPKQRPAQAKQPKPSPPPRQTRPVTRKTVTRKKHSPAAHRRRVVAPRRRGIQRRRQKRGARRARRAPNKPLVGMAACKDCIRQSAVAANLLTLEFCSSFAISNTAKACRQQCRKDFLLFCVSFLQSRSSKGRHGTRRICRSTLASQRGYIRQFYVHNTRASVARRCISSWSQFPR